jgi:hypothetical protein
MSQHARLPALALALACLSLLSACGGGGGGSQAAPGAPQAATGQGASAPGPGAAAPAPGSSSLIPQANTAGIVLYEDTAQLRMLSSPGTRTYRGSDDADSGRSTPVVYTNKVSLAVADDGRYTERHSNLLNGGASTLGAVRIENGAVLASMQIAFREGAPKLTELLTELRGPVRAGDQFGAFERKNVDIGVDLDGDRINETATVAQYSRVMDNRETSVPVRVSVVALRVETQLMVQVTPSSTRLPGPVWKSVRNTWYAPGLGIVRRSLEQPNPIAGKPDRVVSEVLEEWDGGTEGIGALPTQVPLAPASTAFAGKRLQFPQAVAGFPTHAVVAASVADRQISRGIVLAQIDPRGAIVAARDYALSELFPGADFMLEVRLIPHGNFLRMTARLDDGTVRMAHFDATGQQIVRAPTSFGAESLGASDFEGLAYRMTDSFFLTRLRANVFPDGTPYKSAYVTRVDALGGLQMMPAEVIEPVAAQIHNFTVAEEPGVVGYSWREVTAQGSVRRLATVSLNITPGQPVVRRQALALPADACLDAEMVGLQPGLALTCWDPAKGGLSMARLDGDGNPIVGQNSTVATQFVLPPFARDTSRPQFLGVNGELHVAASQDTPQSGNEGNSRFVTVARTNAGGGPSTGTGPIVLAQVHDLPGRVRNMVKVGNRLMLIGIDSNFYMSTTPVWLAN